MTLIELLVSMLLALVVGAAGLAFMVFSFHQQNDISSRTAATRRAEQGLQQLVRDLREAMPSPDSVSISTNSGNQTTSIAFDIPTPSSTGTTDTIGQQVTWTCPSAAAPAANIGTCYRAITPNGGSTTTKSEILGVQSMSLSLSPTGSPTISSTTNPPYLDVILDVQVTSYADSANTPTTVLKGPDGTPSTKPIVVQTGADLRNFS